MKKWLTALLLSVLVISALPVTATAEEVTDEIVVDEIQVMNASLSPSGKKGNICWELADDGTLTITPADGTQAAEIPDDLFMGCSQITKLVIEKGVTSIGECSFQNCDNITEISLPKGLISIGERAFWDSDGFATVTIPSTVTKIYGGAFVSCTKLTSVCFLGDKPAFYLYIINGSGWNRYGPFHGGNGYYPANNSTWENRSSGLTWYACKHSFRDVTCTSTGKCRNCGAVGEDLKDHIFENYVSDNNANCTDDGTQTAVCENCTATNTIPEPDTALGHDYTEATCTEASKCTRCGVTQGYSLGHKYGEYQSNNDAACDKNGTETAVCSRCGQENTRTDYGSAFGHAYGEYVYDDNATCEKSGTETAACLRCGHKNSSIVPGTALGHSFGTYSSDGNATCTEDGTKTAWCERCYESDTQPDPGSALGHDYYRFTSNGDATCTEDGTKNGYCGRCYETHILPDPGSMLPHDFTEATCTEAEVCRDCSAKGEEALGHSYVNYISNGDATCTENGTETAKCDRCQATDTREVANSALGHNLSDKWSMTEDHHWHTCLRCGSEEEKQAHDFSSKEICPVCNYERSHIHDHNPVAAKPSTCTEDGCIAHYICSGCDQRFLFRDGYQEVEASRVILPAAHTYTKATCLTGQTCEVCGAAGSGPLGHDYRNDICTRCGHERNPEKPVTKGVERIFGSGRAETARKVADKLKGQLGVEKFDAILYTSGMNFADALAGSYLSAVKSAPILLYLENSTDPQANLEYIQNNLSENGTVYILGGAAAVPEKVSSQLAERGIDCKRVAGSNRYLTNLEILKEAGFSGGKVLVCTSMNFADSLSASATGLPILLVGKDWTELSADYRTYLADFPELEFVIIGGEAAVHAGLEQNLKDTCGKAMRLAGNTRFETSTLVAAAFFDAPDSAVVAYAMNFPDGLCGGALAFAMDAPLILTASNATNAARDYVRAENIEAGAVLGGKSLISDEAVIDIFGE